MIRGSPLAHARARSMRREMTKPERLLWWALKAKRTGVHFRRQHAAGPYVLDFYCHEARLCVEVDGAQHDVTSARDVRRDTWLAEAGIHTLRVGAVEVLHNLAGVVAAVLMIVEQQKKDLSVSASRCHLP
jgi:very-short-patch-repair endonuclease